MWIGWLVLAVSVVVMIGLGVALLVVGIARAGAAADHDWQLERVERKLDLILTHMNIAHDDHIPGPVVDLARAGRKQEAIDAYQNWTGAKPRVARREIEYLITKLKKPTSMPFINEN